LTTTILLAVIGVFPAEGAGRQADDADGETVRISGTVSRL